MCMMWHNCHLRQRAMVMALTAATAVLATAIPYSRLFDSCLPFPPPSPLPKPAHGLHAVGRPTTLAPSVFRRF
ncbi:hypothetical protein BD413DRAFT_96494 [Trametes elegans]|nr:hypothetical protein BD413DRAFT_96494 [Trametes elegans]